MLAYITLSLVLGFSGFIAYLVNRDKALIFGSVALLSLLPMTYIVHGVYTTLSELCPTKVLGDIGSIGGALVMEPIKMLQGAEGVQTPFAAMGLILFIAFAVGICQVIFARRDKPTVIAA